MSEEVKEQAGELAAWLLTLDAGAERVALALAEAPEPHWQAILASLGWPFTADAVMR